jgi:uncharacterized protein (UPF0276 family)
MSHFLHRVQDLPHLGIGVSTEYGALRSAHALNIEHLLRDHPEFAQFLEVGVAMETGLDDDTLAWRELGRPTTYHFLDINIDDPLDLDQAWLEGFEHIKEILEPAWVCGDAGLWHFGRRERGHMLLLPPILSLDAAKRMADGIVHLRDRLGLEIIPENPPGHVFVGDLHLLDFFAQVMDLADTGMLLDAAHLAIYQDAMGYAPTTGLDAFPTERIVEMHIAGASRTEVEGLEIIEDDHTVEVLPATWQIFAETTVKAPNLKAIVFECERNDLTHCLPGFREIQSMTRTSPFGAGDKR